MDAEENKFQQSLQTLRRAISAGQMGGVILVRAGIIVGNDFQVKEDKGEYLVHHRGLPRSMRKTWYYVCCWMSRCRSSKAVRLP